MRTISLVAPAKVNLFLGIGSRRVDGYHDVTTVMHALAMHDRLTMTHIAAGEHVTVVEPNDPAQPERQEEVRVEAGSGLSVAVRTLCAAGIPRLDVPMEDNLVCRAIRTLASFVGRVEDEVIRVVLEKGIPHRAGLGGGSSDAAAALVGAAHIWGIGLNDPVVCEAAQVLGADVRFFLDGGCALLEGRGDEFVRHLEPRRDSIAIVRPDVGVSTAQAYGVFDQSPQLFDDDILQSVRMANRAIDVPLGNNLEIPAFAIAPEVEEVRGFAEQFPGVSASLVSGSGSAVFAICQSYSDAQAIAAAAQRRGYWARATSFSGIRAAILPLHR